MSVIIDPSSPASAVESIRSEMARLACTPSPQLAHDLAYLESLAEPVSRAASPTLPMKRPPFGGARKTRRRRAQKRATRRR